MEIGEMGSACFWASGVMADADGHIICILLMFTSVFILVEAELGDTIANPTIPRYYCHVLILILGVVVVVMAPAVL